MRGCRSNRKSHRAATTTRHRYPRAVVGTAKRERQKANRQQRLIEEAKVERTSKMKRSILRGTLAVVAIAVAVVAVMVAGVAVGVSWGK